MKYNKTVKYIGWIVFFLTTILYIFTMYPTVAFWDCGEFITTASSLQVGHAPGSPLYQIIGAIFSIFSFSNVKLIAPLINSISAIASGLSIMLLFWIFVYLFNKYSDKFVGNIVAALIASLIFAFTDSFWTSSSEAEVYSLSFFFTALVFWLILRWDDKPHTSIIFLIVFVLGLSYGVHPLTLLIIPAVVFVIYFHYFVPSLKGILLTILVSIGILFVFMNAFPTLLLLLSFSPVLIITLIFLIIIGLIVLSHYKNLPLLNSITLAFVFFFIGCSTYFMIMIRANENLSVIESKPNTCLALRSYINRDNYLKAPIVYGQYYTALPPQELKIKNNKIVPVFDKTEKTIFPRMWNYNNTSYEDGYIEWVGSPEDSVIIDGEQRQKPTFVQNIRFFLKYQVGYMYFRYLLWNFSGKTNDVQGYGDITNGQWKTGLIYTDKIIGVNEGNTKLSASNPANNRYFAIPLILCLIGIFYHIVKDAKNFIVVASIFVMYSIAIVVYVNQAAYEPRERDYSYLPSFMAISIWIGIGILGISQIIANIIKIRKPRYILPLFLIVPVWMAIQNFNDHNHRHQYTAYNFAVSMLNSCEKNAILFVNGDNDTYPLWYCQNVEHIRTDVRVINRELLNEEPTINSLTRINGESQPIKLSIRKNKYNQGKMQLVEVSPSFDTVKVKDALQDVFNDKGIDNKLGECVKSMKANKLYFLNNKDTMFLSINKPELTRSDIVLLDIIDNNINNRPIYFSSYSNDDFVGLEDYMNLEGFAYRLGGTKKEYKEVIQQKAGVINSDVMYENIIHNFSFKNFDKKHVYYNEIERNIVKEYIGAMSALSYKLCQENQVEKARAIMNKCLATFSVDKFYYPYGMADMAVVYSAIGDQEQAEQLMDKSIAKFEYFINYYNNATIRYQSQNRLEAQKAIEYYMNLCILTEEWGLDEMRGFLSNSFFNEIQPYLEVTYRQKKMMMLKEDYYRNEIKKVDDLIDRIKDIANHYEENIPEEK